MDGARQAPRRLTVLLSGGVDSQAVLAALQESGKEPVALSFYAGEHWSRDVTLATEAARRLGVKCTPWRLDVSEKTLREYVHWAVWYGLRGKASIECFYPRKVAMDVLGAASPGIATGDGGDGYFGLSKKAMIHVRPGGAAAMDEFRRWYFGRVDWSQTASIRRYAEERDLYVSMPLADPRLLDACRGYDWEALNRPRQKQPIRDAFPDLLTGLPPHTNLQLGDSGIAEAFRVLTPDGSKSPVAYYNRVAASFDARVPDEDEAGPEDGPQGSLW